MINLQYYSPEEEIHHPLFKEKQVQVFIKRDDLIHPFISGNKWRKLKYPLRQAQQSQKKHLVTFGGAYSNHLLATACAAAKFGFKSTGFVRGEAVENDMLMFCRLFGMNLIFVSRESYRDKRALFDQYFGQDEEAFFIDEGGAGPEAAKGCSELVEELSQHYDHLFCASGTGTTAAGILAGLQAHQPDCHLHVIPVLKNGGFIRQEMENYFDQSPAFDLHTDYHFGGYAKTTPELLKFIQQFASDTGILPDPVYTGKMLFALFELIRQDQFTPGSKILAIHTGGLFGLLGMAEKIQKVIF
ncbi:MAG TPA: pyridoxal-phosphate dependent enzyme [Daejeonella sp.]|nr:pyridoxal-phosphate dependent enzyme [Daejeonella sp.]